MPCPSNPSPPDGFQVWAGAVPAELTRWAVALRDHEIGKVPYWTVWSTTYQGAPVLARKDYHTWTYKDGQLIQGICIPGITLYAPSAPLLARASYTLPAGTIETSLDGTPERTVDPRVVVGAGIALAATVGLFWLAIRLAGNK